MPTVLHVGPYRFFFVSSDSREPAHVHVRRENMVAKFWLEPVVLERPGGFKSHELDKMGRLVQENRDLLLERWHEHFGN